jgi:PAS domain S-box-containing protein
MNLAHFRQQLAALSEQAREAQALARSGPEGDPARARLLAAAHGLEDAGRALQAQAEALQARYDASEAERRRYRSLFEFAPDGYLITDPRGRILEANWAAGILLNTSEEALVGQALFSFVDPDELAGFLGHLERLETVAGVREWETRLRARDYASFHAAVTAAPERDPAGAVTAVRWLVRDVTARKRAAEEVKALNADLERRVRDRTTELEAANRRLQGEITDRARAEAALRVSQARVAAIVGSAMDAIVTIDEDQRIVLFNAAAERMFRCTTAEVLGQTIDRFLPAWARDAHQQHIRRFGATGTTSRRMGALGTLTAIRTDGDEFPIEASISQTRTLQNVFYTVILRDITSRVEAETALRRRAQQQAVVARLGQRALAGAGMMALITEAVALVAGTLEADFCALLELLPGGESLAVRASQGWPALPGSRPVPADPDSQAGYTLLSPEPVVVADARAGPRFRLPEALAAVGATSGVSVALRHSGRAFGVLAAHTRQRRDFSPEDANFMLSVANVLAAAVERSRAEAEIRALNAGLERRVAERTAELEAKNRELETFTYSVSHDLKAPLRGIEGFSRVLVEDYADRLDDDGRASLDTIRRAVQQMNQLIDDLLAYSRLERRALLPQPLELRDLVEGLLGERASELKARGVRVAVDVPEVTVSADSEGLAQAIRNLIDNALKFTAGVPAPLIEIGARTDGELCRLWVRDNGIGFDPAFGERIFGIFQRLHRPEDYPGTGIGLAIVQKAMRRMHGRAWAEAEAGRGACFYLEMPATAGELAT